MRFPLVLITWYDVVAIQEWLAEKDLPAPALIYSVGYLVKETPGYKVIVNMVGDDQQDETPYGDAQAIPVKMIESIRVIEARNADNP